MKILSKYKDYFVYLAGIYGEDPKLILDRTNAEMNSFKPREPQLIYINFCGTVYIGLWTGNYVIYHYEELEQFCKENSIELNSNKNWTYIRVNGYRTTIPKSLKFKLKLKVAYGICIKHTPYADMLKEDAFTPYPVLKEYNFNSLFSPEEAWIEISNWLSAINTESDTIKITDKQKIVNHGFDLKSSFRNIK